MKRAEKARITKENLYLTAVKLINERGYDNVFVEDITDAAGLGKGTFYYYFETKEQLLAYTLEFLGNYYQEALKEAESKTGFYNRLTTFLNHAYPAIENGGREVGRAIHVSLLKNSLNVTYFNKSRDFNLALLQIVEYGIKQGELDPNKLDYYNRMILILLAGAENYWLQSGEDESLTEIVMESIEMAFAKFSDD